MISAYLDAARARLALPSDRALAAHLGFAHPIVSRWRNGKDIPTDANMVRIAEAAGLDPNKALLELSAFRADSRNEAAPAKVYRGLLAKLIASGVLAVTLAAPALLLVKPDIAGRTYRAQFSGDCRPVYIMLNRRRPRRLGASRFFNRLASILRPPPPAVARAV